MKICINKICVPTDFSEAADHAVRYGAALASQVGAELHVLHVLEQAGPIVHHPDFTAHGDEAKAFFTKMEEEERGPEEDASVIEEVPDDEPGSEDSTSRFLRDLAQTSTDKLEEVSEPWWQNMDVRKVVRYGHPVEEINRYANKNAVDLVVMGTHGHSKLARVLIGSVTERVVQTCPCPVIAVRHPDHDYTVIE